MNESLRIIYMGSPDFAVAPLYALIEAGYKPLYIISRPDKRKGRGAVLSATALKAAAQKIGLPVYTPQNVNEPQFIEDIYAIRPDLLITVAYGQILKRELLQIPRLGALNLHASLLPAYRGAAPIQRALMQGANLSGVTTMYMDEGLDTGDIILSASCEIDATETGGTLHDKLMFMGADLLCCTVGLIDAGLAPRRAQDDSLASYAHSLTAKDEIVDWQMSALKIHNQIRALNPWPKAYCLWGDKRIKLGRSQFGPTRFPGKPGEVIAIDKQGMWIACQEGELCLNEVQPQGKSLMDACAFARGYGIKEGSVFN
ncbi:MAG: methionyl-tRNA formyltransferase [Firmicutes bacterium]|nr:methionyl-tRNA formyltransferase [Bacillota bacterium]